MVNRARLPIISLTLASSAHSRLLAMWSVSSYFGERLDFVSLLTHVEYLDAMEGHFFNYYYWHYVVHYVCLNLFMVTYYGLSFRPM